MARDRFDDETDDRDNDRPARRRRGAVGDPERGRRALAGPAIGLILVGLITLGLVGYGLLTGGGAAAVAADLAERRKDQLAQIDAGPGTADQKQQQKDVVNKMYDFGDKLAPLSPLISGLAGVGGLLILAGGVQLFRGRGRGLGMTSSVLAMIPCFSSCACVLGIPVGIWALVVLGGADAKAAFAAGRRPDTFADDRDDLR